jgi:hypothetical protein
MEESSEDSNGNKKVSENLAIKELSFEDQLKEQLNQDASDEETVNLNNIAVQQLVDILQSKEEDYADADEDSSSGIEIDEIYMEMIKDGAMTIEDYILYNQM